MAEISPDAVFDNLIDKDKTTEIVGFVDELHATRTVGKNLEHKIFKFVLTNQNNKISCLIWNEVITKHESHIQMNRIIHITGGTTKETFKKDNFVPFEIIIMNSTILDYLGFHVLNAAEVLPPIEPILVDFETISGHNDELISITSFAKQTFGVIESRFENMSFGSTAITDGTVKINIEIANYSVLEYQVDSKVTVIGVFSYSGYF